MTHTPPIPAGNQSPYPLHEPPHRKTESVYARPDGQGEDATREDAPSALLPIIAVAIGVGAATAMVAALLFMPRDGAEGSRETGKR